MYKRGAEFITLKNEFLNVVVSTLGAELKSIKKNNKEYLWTGDKNVWSFQAPILFPICGSLKDNKFSYKGKEYKIKHHGYARFKNFTVETLEDTKAVFSLCSDDESKKCYPFDYEFKVSYSLEGTSIKVGYSAKNLTDGDMYFSVGGHEGYLCPEGIEDYTLCFSENENLDSTLLEGSVITRLTKKFGKDTKELPLKSEYFDLDTLIFLNLKSRSVALKNSDRKLRIDFDGMDYLLIWTVAGKDQKFVCIEPWCGIPDYADRTNNDITQKDKIIKLSKNETFDAFHTITIEK